MALARSVSQPIWLLSRYALGPHASAASLGHSRCSIRHYSDQQLVVEENSSMSNQASSSKSTLEQQVVKKSPVSLLISDVNAMPGLSALDELNPYTTSSQHAKIRSKNQDDSFEVWRRTMERVMSSFTLRQLRKMSIDAQIPRKVYRSYNVRKDRMPTKKPIVKALLSQRFGMKDPDLEAELLAAKAKSKQSSKSLEIPLTQIALLLLVLRGQSEMQRLAQLHRVRMRPFKKDSDDDIALLLEGSEPSIEIVKKWIISFCESIRSVTSPLSSYSATTTSVQPLSDHRLRLLSQKSQAVVSLDENEENVTIYSVEDTSLNSAQSLLMQCIHNVQLAQTRQFYSYASPAIPSDTMISFPMYGFVPHIGPTPIPWLADPGPNASLFRITRQDITGADEVTFSNIMQDNPDKPLLRSLKTAETYDTSGAARVQDDAFAQLRDQLQIPENSTGSLSYTAEFGHLLFDNDGQAGSSRVLNLVSPPLPGTWPLEHSLEWLRKLKQNTETIPTSPSFCSAIPPLVANLDSGLVPSMSTANFSSTSDGDASPTEKLRRRSEYWAEQLQQFGFPIQSNAKHQLADIVDVNTSNFKDVMLITYTGDTADLEIQLLGKADEEESAMVFLGAQLVKRTMADVLVPESCIDLRLGVIHNEELTEEMLVEDEDLQRYLTEQKVSSGASIDNSNVEERAALLPQTVVVKGRKFFMVNAKRVCRWEWQLFNDTDAQFKGKLVMEKPGQSEARDAMSSFKIVFDEIPQVNDSASGIVEGADSQDESFVEDNGEHKIVSSEDEHVGEENKSKVNTKIPSDKTSIWRVMRPLVGFFLARGYRTLLR